MKKITAIAIITFMSLFISNKTFAQTDYTFTLIDNGAYSFSVAAVPSSTTSNFATSIQSYGFTITLPDGVTASITSSLGGGAGATFFDGNNVGQPSIDGYLITETLAAPISLPAPSANVNTTVVTFTVNGNPTSGELILLANDSALATTVTPLQAFMQADTTNDGTVNYSNRINSASGLSGTTNISFATLSTEDSIFSNVAIYPNPVKNVLNIKGLDNTIKSATIFNLTGQRVISQTENLNEINTSSLTPGVYFLNLETQTASKTIKIVKE